MNVFSNFLTASRKTYLRMASSSSTSGKYDFVERGKKILGAALNYMDIVRSRNVPVPEEPLLFLKPTTSYEIEGNPIVIPKVFTKVAHEVELGVVIGKRCKNVKKEQALNYVGGYCLALDMTAQCNLGTARKNGHPWSLGKGFDTSTPVSRFISCDEIKDPHSLPLWLKVNGELRQQGNTQDLIFKVDDLIAHASKYMTLEPNDLLLTGTPDGALPVKAGDVIEAGIGVDVQIKFMVVNEGDTSSTI
ncbi:PREDICTED: acylpyruvase FAHD1, mitochondrial [Rhagoletis zephyria]|nr:PREDICTED: acylpyruvase FAHD1, mitochondrial [Rhagoletis zephyria]XP_017469941.1 PREDICTED: acylpyruvase FAHD1, mitochondrial [Rhagoletis zephyria]XP_017469942.1 PREDICTED: acylpyruvase FAHD1, mitochondrial [Rhagoletis zephyria]XP_017469943.1 PREDICTED: acylpyruvase FAHD1, mitochondrial [Rhagoletis zephyria]XP_017469945.1 PREDICTED: acylpyruvase FAHD1, mitochondrial [Rhagoletis zephyria]XP_017469946.1 PREDICTED: acylpyruvase FAHD1, mitochondrial [Rhagoletis zephyria]